MSQTSADVIAALVSSVLALGALGISVRIVSRLREGDGSPEVLRLLRNKPAEVEALLTGQTSHAARLAHRVLHSPTLAAARAEIREASLELSASQHARTIPIASGKAGLTLGTLGAVIEIAQGLPDLVRPTLWASVAFGVGLIAWMGCTYLSKEASRLARGRYGVWRELNAVLEGLASGEWPAKATTAKTSEDHVSA